MVIKKLLVGPTKEEAWDNIKNMNPQDMLISSVKNGILDGVKLSIDEGANIHHDSGFLLRFAASSGSLEVFNYLIGKGLEDYIREFNYVILKSAVEGGNLDIVKYLIEKSTNNGISDQFQQMLRIAEMGKHKDIEEYLINYKNDNYMKW